MLVHEVSETTERHLRKFQSCSNRKGVFQSFLRGGTCN